MKDERWNWGNPQPRRGDRIIDEIDVIPNPEGERIIGERIIDEIEAIPNPEGVKGL